MKILPSLRWGAEGARLVFNAINDLYVISVTILYLTEHCAILIIDSKRFCITTNLIYKFVYATKKMIAKINVIHDPTIGIINQTISRDQCTT